MQCGARAVAFVERTLRQGPHSERVRAVEQLGGGGPDGRRDGEARWGVVRQLSEVAEPGLQLRALAFEGDHDPRGRAARELVQRVGLELRGVNADVAVEAARLGVAYDARELGAQERLSAGERELHAAGGV